VDTDVSATSKQIASPPAPGGAISAADLTDLRVTEMIYSTQVLTMTGHIRIDEPDSMRFLVMRLAAHKPDESEMQVFAHDFILSYQVPGDDGPQEQRAKMEAIAEAAERAGDFGSFRHGVEPRVTVDGANVEIALAAIVENDVDEVSLFRMGTTEAITFSLPERRYSVYVTTTRGMQVAQQVAAMLDSHGYQAATSDGLADHTGILLRYGEHAEAAAREVQELLQQQFGGQVTVEELDETTVVCEYDMLLWVGD